jgi:hypothetical protein
MAVADKAYEYITMSSSLLFQTIVFAKQPQAMDGSHRPIIFCTMV